MEQLTYSIDIDAPRETVWKVLWGDDTYPAWTSAFGPGSQAKTDWKEGSKVLFLGGEGAGMVSRINRRRDNEFMSFKHLGIVKDGVEDLESAEAKSWSGGTENYTLTTVNGKTHLLVEMSGEMELPDEFKEFFKTAWPNALDKLRELAESV